MKLAAIVIWYNPDQEAVDNILTYSSLFYKIFVVDNSKGNNELLLNKMQNCIYIPNLKNEGIAKALNTGCLKAKQEDFDWVMTMDQDSSWDSDQLEKFISLLDTTNDSLIKSYAPVHRNSLRSVAGDIKYKTEQKSNESFIFQDKVMTSGNIINLSAWQEVDGFNEKLFIDEVDHEFCYKLIKKGFKIYEDQTVIMSHTLGHVKKTILPRPCKHSGVRLFYIFRNMNYIKENFPEMFKKHGYKKYMFYAIIQKHLEFNFKDLKFIHLGIKAYKNNKYGPFEK